MKTVAVIVLLLVLPLAAQANKSQTKRVRIQDLTAVEEKGVTPAEMQKALITVAQSYTTNPDQIITGNSPNLYINANSPNLVTQANNPNTYTHGNFPARITIGRLLGTGEINEIPMPNMNLAK